VIGKILKCTKKHTFIRFKNSDLPRLQSKEDYIDSQLQQWARDEKIPMYTSRNKKINGCSARPDFAYNLPTHWVVLEVDEFQHTKTFQQCHVYKPRDEFQRMCDLCSAASKPVVILRYNPDAFQISGKTSTIETADRVALLLERLEYYLKLACSANFITVEYLFYSKAEDDYPFIHCFSFAYPTCMTNWIDVFGVSWETVTLCEAIESVPLNLQIYYPAVVWATPPEPPVWATPPEPPPHLTHPDESLPEKLVKTYVTTELSVFEAMSLKEQMMYDQPYLKEAFRRQTILRTHGPDFPSAVSLILQSGKFPHDMQACMLVTSMFRLFTGLDDPFQTTRKSMHELEHRMECTPTTNDMGKLVVTASYEKTRAVFSIYNRIIELDPILFTPAHPIKDRPRVFFMESLTILKQMLKHVLGINYVRVGRNGASTASNPDFMYVTDGSYYFAERYEKQNKPIISPWNQLADNVDEYLVGAIDE